LDNASGLAFDVDGFGGGFMGHRLSPMIHQRITSSKTHHRLSQPTLVKPQE
jgi:hypothetical protein